MLAPVVFLLLAGLSAAFVAYGIHPAWGQFDRGLEMICLARRLQWPLLGASVVFCLALVGLVVAGKKRAWWLVGLGPIVALFAHRFATGAPAQWQVVENPPAIAAAQVTSLSDDQWVVAANLGGIDYAFPFSSLYRAPVVLHDQRERRYLLIWSATANRATLLEVERTVHGRDLDIVSNPADGLLVYHSRYGQFICGFTGQTPQRTQPVGVKRRVSTDKVPFGIWRKSRPDGQVIVPAAGTGPGVPLLPQQPLPRALRDLDGNPVVLIEANPPAIVLPPAATSSRPVNLSAGDHRLLLMPPRRGSQLALERRAASDLVPAFAYDPDGDGKAPLIDADTETRWSYDGVAISGALKGERLAPLAVDTGLDPRIVRFWYPDALVAQSQSEPTIRPTVLRPEPPKRPARSNRRAPASPQ